MTGAEYDALARACDRLLRAPDTSLARLSLPLLHVINEHPALLSQYAALFAPDGHRVAADAAGIRPTTIVTRATRALRRALERHWDARDAALEPRDSAASVDVLIVSRASSLTALTRADDFYFGSLQRMLNERGATAWVAMVDHIGEQTPARQSALHDLPPARSLLPCRVSLSTELALWHSCLSARRTLLSSAAAVRDPLERQLAIRAAEQLLSGAALGNLRLHDAVFQLCRRLRPRIVITTYEGDASERVIWHAARSGGAALCVGYQHTTLLPRAHAIRRAVCAPGIACDPDVILALGETTRAALAESKELGAVRLLTYGSHRRPHLVAPEQLGQREARCLVLPDAAASEAAALFEFALDCAREMAEITFVLRPHPSSDYARAAARPPPLAELPRNVEISHATSFEAECLRARFCLYRGSSAAMYAVLAGIKPFYLARAGELPFDPLSGLPDWRETVRSPRDLAVGVAAQVDTRALERAQCFCTRYVAPLQPQAIDALLAMAPPARNRLGPP
jgi:hypothetical protein